MSIPTLLEVEIEDQFESLHKAKFGSEEYTAGVNGLTKLLGTYKEMNEFEHNAIEEQKNREFDKEFKEKQMRENKKSQWFRYGIDIASLVLPLGVAIWGTVAEFAFENDGGCITTLMGRGWLNKLLPKK